METRHFRIDHNKLLLDVIRRQAGSLTKAIMEGVMNAVDAGATRCDIAVTADTVTITDNGKGFASKKEIQEWFEVFGAAHSEEEAKTFGTFRMGRGQMFAYGVNKWTTNKHSMTVDIEKTGCSYAYAPVEEPVRGCRVEIALYTQLSQSDVWRVERDVTAGLQWVEMPVCLNTKDIQESRPAVKWAIDNDTFAFAPDVKHAWVLKLYNQGVFIRDLPSSQFGAGGVLLFKKSPKVNFARNDIQSDCELWQGVQAQIDAYCNKAIAAKVMLSDAERTSLREKLGNNLLMPSQYKEAQAVTLVTGKHCKLSELLATYLPICVSPEGDVQGDFAHRAGKAFVISAKCLTEFGFSQVSELCDWLNALESNEGRKYYSSTVSSVIADVAAPVVLSTDKTTLRERKWKYIIQRAYKSLTSRWDSQRVVMVGTSLTSEAWTDGTSYVCFARNFLASAKFSKQGYFEVGRVLLHELCHDESSKDEAHHDQRFYEKFHDESGKLFGFVEAAALAARAYKVENVEMVTTES